MNSTDPVPAAVAGPPDLETLAKMYYSDKISIAIGSQFMAVTCDAVFLGILVAQAIKWAGYAYNDPRHVRYLLTIALCGCLAGTCYTWSNYFHAFVLGFGTFLRFASWHHLGLYALFNGFVIVPVETLYAVRAVRINGNNVYLAIWLSLLLLGTTTCTIGSIVTSRGHTMFDGTQMMVGFFLAQSAICFTTHLSVTAAICLGLWRNKEGTRWTNGVIDNIIWVVLEGQIPGTIISFLAILLPGINLANPFIPWLLITHPKMYMMGCMAMINTRHTWSREGRFISGNGNGNGTGPSHQTGSSSTIIADPTTPPPPANRVSVRRSIIQMFDDVEPTTITGKHHRSGSGTGSESEKDKDKDQSFGPILSELGLGSKISMV